MASHDQEILLAVLDYWRKVEFFIPYGLDQRLDDLEPWQFKQLLRETLSSDSLTLDVPADREVRGYTLYLGVFDKSAISQVCDSLGLANGERADPLQAFEEEARSDLEGISCFAKVGLDAAGHIRLDSVSISTAPWAMGQTRANGLSALGYDAFAAAQHRLIALLGNFMSARGELAGQPLAAREVADLHALLCNWAGFWPDAEQPLAVLEAWVKPRTEASNGEQPQPAAEVQPAAEEDETEEEPTDLDILNSFYIKDIERAIQSVRGGAIPAALHRYLIPLAPQARIDLYSEQGHAALMQGLRPRLMNHGHWFASPRHPMSLMQQFALNQSRLELEDSGLFSVNGPPGTGKTTLLRDVFADNIVRRARVLAGLATPDAGFVKDSISVRFKGADDPVKVRPLIDALTGFEMVVASTNNAAVENISLDLVKRKALDEAWPNVSYLQPVAHNMALQISKQGVNSPVGEEMPWGLLTCALGNSRNRKHFKERVFINVFASEHAETPLTLWRWLATPRSASFSAAQTAFKQADLAVEQALATRERLADLYDQLGQQTYEGYVAQCLAETTAAQGTIDHLSASLNEVVAQQKALQHTLFGLTEEQALIDRTAPPWWARWLRTAEAKAYTERRKANAHEQLTAHGQAKAAGVEATRLGKAQREAADQLHASEQRLAVRTAAWQALQQERLELEQQLGKPVLPEALADLETDVFQVQGVWHDEPLATLRSQLFAAALALQEAWVYQAGQKGGALRSNLVAVSKAVAGEPMEDPSHALAIWQNLFMVIPVVSSTFASFANQFRDLGPGALGWVFIDEAGQAVPQAAVGALWRAKRCIVVGDPLQIEPVFTLPARLITALGQLSAVTANDHYAPHRVSVQTLADQANRFGTYATVQHQRLWIGSPLRVHRPCNDPMFSLANRIAYDDKMVYGLTQRQPSPPTLIDLPSGWINIPGAVARKQVVTAQVTFIADTIVALFQRDQKLPELYVISPFRAIRDAVRQTLSHAQWQGQAPSKLALRQWLKRSVGTVHTFQGREQKTVFMVLGTDPNNLGGAQWAASRPNLLNVAVTRAQHKVFLVGDAALWGALPYFKDALVGDVAMPVWGRGDVRV